jgi:hypothetical protein
VRGKFQVDVMVELKGSADRWQSRWWGQRKCPVHKVKRERWSGIWEGEELVGKQVEREATAHTSGSIPCLWIVTSMRLVM